MPRTAYQQWLKDNARYEATFWALKEEIVEHYEEIVEQVVEDVRPLAEDAWQRVTLGRSVLKQLDRLSTELLSEVVEQLRAGYGKETFVENYLSTIRRAMPDRETMASSFAYEYERGVIPLPSLLASDMEQADRIYRERTLRDARVRAELEAIEAQRRAEMQKLSTQQQREREEQYQRLRLERDRQQQQLAMERDVLLDARRQKEHLVHDFYASVVARINALIFSVTENVLDSLGSNHQQLRGPVSHQLRNLVSQLEQLNFVEDEQIERQIASLQSILPTANDSKAAANGTTKIDTTRINTVVTQINAEAQHILIDLGQRPVVRRRRQGETPLATTGTLITLGTRTACKGAALSTTATADPNTKDTPTRRSRKKPL